MRQASILAQNPNMMTPSRMFKLSETNFFNEMHQDTSKPGRPSVDKQDIRLGMRTYET